MEIFTNRETTLELDMKTMEVKSIPSEGLDNLFFMSRNLVAVRKPVVEMLTRLIYGCVAYLDMSPVAHIDAVMEDVINGCDPSTDLWNIELEEYANILGIEPNHAYKELRLRGDSIKHAKIRAQAWLVYFTQKLKIVNTKEDADKLRLEIYNKLVGESSI